jgi:translation initiation factor IF-1
LSKQDVIEVEGVVSDSFPNAMFEVELENGHKILAHISGKLRMNFIRILPGDSLRWSFLPMTLHAEELLARKELSGHSS